MLPSYEPAGAASGAGRGWSLPGGIRGEVRAERVQNQPNHPIICRRDLP